MSTSAFRMLSVTVLLIGALVPVASAELLPSYDLVGEDAKGDMVLPLATGVNYPACGTGLGCDKYDILSLEMADTGTAFQIKLNVGASYSGTSMIIYAVHFMVAEAAYLACWNINSAGPTGGSEDLAENTFACSRFAGETQVGPADRAGGVETDTGSDGRVYVLWEVKKAALKEYQDGMPLTGVVAEIWARTPSTCCAGSQAPAQYMFNRADVAPDAESWIYAGPAAEEVVVPPIALEVEKNSIEVPSGGSSIVAIKITNSGDADEQVKLSWDSPADGFEVSFDPRVLDVEAGGEALTEMTVKSTAKEGTEANVTIVAEAGDLTVEVPLAVKTTRGAEPKSSPTPSLTTSTTTGPAETSDTGAPLTEEKSGKAFGIPGPELALVLGALAFLVALRRRRT